LTYDADGRTTLFQDPSGRLTTYSYDSDSRKTMDRLPSGITNEYAYDAAGQTLGIDGTTSASSTVNSFSFTYDGNGNRVSVRDYCRDSYTTYSYDAKDRVTREQFAGPDTHDFAYAYDGNDNLLYSGEKATTFTLDAAGRIVTSVDLSGLTTFGYDANGNNTGVVQYDGLNLEMSYNMENRLTVYASGTTVATFTYSGNGLKTSESEGSVTTTLVWDGDDYLQGRS
jgi:YD repeat-containing protein